MTLVFVHKVTYHIGLILYHFPIYPYCYKTEKIKMKNSNTLIPNKYDYKNYLY